MTIEKAFKRQITEGVPVSAELLSERQETKYHVGTKIEVGHIILHALTEYSGKTMELVIIGAHQLDLYELDENFREPRNSFSIPHIKLKQ